MKRKETLKIIVFLLMLQKVAFSANITWTNGAGNNDFNTAGNWSTGTVPGSSDVAIFDGTSNANSSVSANVTLGGITVNGYTGTININSYTFQITSGNCDFTSGTINEGTLTINTTGSVTFAGTTFGATVNSVSATLKLNGSIFNSTASLEKNGSSGDAGSGGNKFLSDVTIKNSGSGYIFLGNSSSPDSISSNLTLENTGTNSLYFAYKSSGNYIGGNLTVTNNATGTTDLISICDQSGSGLTVDGNTEVNNSGGSSQKRVYLSHSGSITFNGTLTIKNSSSATYSEVYCNFGNTSSNTYNGNIIVECTNSSCAGIIFGLMDGTGTLASGKTITVGSGGFIGGQLQFRKFTQSGSTSQSISLSGTAKIYNYNSDWGGDVTFIAPQIVTYGTHYRGTAYLEFTGSSGNSSSGLNVFEKNTEIKNSGSSYFMMGTSNPDTCNANLTLNNTGTHSLYYAYSSSKNYIAGNLSVINNPSGTSDVIIVCDQSGSGLTIDGNTTVTNNGGSTTKRVFLGNDGSITFNGTLTLTNNSSATYSEIICNFNFNSSNTYNGNIIVESTNASCYGIHFGMNGGMGTLSSGKTITIGSGGFIAGDLKFRKFYQSGTTAQSLTCTGTAKIYNYDCEWGGNVSFVAPRIYSKGTRYKGTVLLEKTGANNDDSPGGNIFEKNTEIKNSGSGYLMIGTSISDTCRANLTLNNTGTNSLYYAYGAPASYIAGNLSVVNNSSGTAGWVSICEPSGSKLTINGNTTVSNNGGNTIKRVILAHTGNITFNGTLSITNNSSASYSEIYCNYYDGSSNIYNDDITVECLNSSCDGILFGSMGGAGTLAAGKKIIIGSGGFIAGELVLGSITQSGSTAQAITLTGTAKINVSNSDWGGDVTFTAPKLLTSGTHYRGTAYFEVTGTVGSSSDGGNVFDKNTEIKNSGSAYVMFGSSNPDTCKANLTINNLGSSSTYFAYSSSNNYIAGDLTVNNNPSGSEGNALVCDQSGSSLTVNGHTTAYNTSGGTTKKLYLGNYGSITFNGTVLLTNNSSASGTNMIRCNDKSTSSNVYNDDIEVESTNSNVDGVYFGLSGGQGTLASGKIIKIGSNGFKYGNLSFRNFVQLGSTAQSLTITNSSLLFLRECQWNGNVHFVAPRIRLIGSTFNGTAYLESNGSSDNNSYGGNVFNDNTEIVNSGSGEYYLAMYGDPNDFNANVKFVNSGTGKIYPAYDAACTFAKNINFDFNYNVVFGGDDDGRVILDGTTAQSINDVGGSSPRPTFRDFQTNNPNSEITLNTPIEIGTELDLDNGNIITTSTNLLIMSDSSSVSSVSADAYVDGPVEKIGNSAFTFPVGDDGYYAPASISAPASSTDRFRVQFFHQDPNNAGNRTSVASSLHHISYNEYWEINRVNGSSAVDVSLQWDTVRSGPVDDLAELSVSHWDGSQWEDYGNDATTGSFSSGTIKVNSVNSFSPFTLASSTSSNPLPISLYSFGAELVSGNVFISWETVSELNNDYFVVERSVDGIHFRSIGVVKGKGNSKSLLKYNLIDNQPVSGMSYYRLTQVDYDGSSMVVSNVAIINNTSKEEFNLQVYPNPSTGYLFVNVSMPALLKIISFNGKIIFCKQLSAGNNKIYLEGISSGIYYVKALTNSNVVIKKLVVE